MEDEVIELMSTFPINAKWVADHPEGSNAIDIETAATLSTMYQVLHDIFAKLLLKVIKAIIIISRGRGQLLACPQIF